MQHDTPQKFSPVTVLLHWLVGLTIIGLLGVGIYMKQTETYALYPIHKSIGVLIFAVVLVRVAWRIKNGWPTPAGTYKKIEQILAKIVHYVLLIGSALIPLSGMTMSGMGGHGIKVFGFELVARNVDALDPGKTVPINGDIAGLAHSAHTVISYIVISALVLHVVGALKHHFVDKDGTILRMLGRNIGGGE